MRVTAKQKADTKQRIVDVSVKLFRKNGYAETTTRDIAVAADIAAGTLFNYFPTKESIVYSLAAAALARARRVQQGISGNSLGEELFACIAAEIRQLKPHRKYFSVLLETCFNPLVDSARGRNGETLRTEHLEIVSSLVRRRGLGDLSPLALQLYWTLHTGVLVFWCSDKSRKQEDTLALIDQSVSMFVNWLDSEPTAFR